LISYLDNVAAPACPLNINVYAVLPDNLQKKHEKYENENDSSKKAQKYI